jgi:hypothetical protein
MKAVLLVTLLSMGSVSAEGCVSCLGALAKTAELVDTLASVDDAERQRALERKVVLLEEEQAVRAELSRVRQQADRLERAREARALRAAAPTVATATAAVLAVLELEPRAGLGPESASALTALVHLELLATGRVVLVPLERTREALRATSAEHAGARYDDRCQLELGKALAARALVRPVLQPDGHGCVLALELYDLTRETLEWARSERTGCEADALAATARRLAQVLVAPAEDPTPVLVTRTELPVAPPRADPLRAPLVPR